MAKGVIVGLLPLHVQQMDSTNHWLLAATIVEEEEELAATFVEEELELAATFVDKRTSGAAPLLPIKGHRERAKCKRDESGENVKSIERKWRAAMAAALLPLQQLQVQQEIWELSLSEVILLLHVCCNPFSIYL